MLNHNYLAQAETITNPLLSPFLQSILKAEGGIGLLRIILPNFIGLAFIIGSVIFLFIIIVGAIQWISSGGDKNAVEGARGKITNAIIGIVILFSVYAIIMFIENFFGISILTLDIGNLIIR